MVNVPVINIKGLLGSKEEQLKTARFVQRRRFISLSHLNNTRHTPCTHREIGKACKEIGFFVIEGHDVDPAIIENAW